MTHRNTVINILSIFTFMMLIIVGRVPTARADFYKYTDRSGAVCITNDPNAVPPKYRATMKVVRDEVLEKKDMGARKQAPQQAPPTFRDNFPSGMEQTPAGSTEPVSRTESLTGRFPWLKPLAVITGIGVLFLIVSKVACLLSSPQLSRLIYLGFFLGISVFGFKLYAESMTNNYRTIKTKVHSMFIKANERQAPEMGEKAPGSSQSGQPLNGILDKNEAQ